MRGDRGGRNTHDPPADRRRDRHPDVPNERRPDRTVRAILGQLGELKPVHSRWSLEERRTYARFFRNR